MIIKTEAKTIEEFHRFFNSQVTNYESFSVKIYLKPREKLYGSINGSDIWIVETKQLVANIPQRFFRGEIVEDPGSLHIVGKFRFSTMTYVWTAAAIISCLIIFASTFSHDAIVRNPVSNGLIALAVVCSPLLILGIGLLTSRSREKDVVRFLQGAENGDKASAPNAE